MRDMKNAQNHKYIHGPDPAPEAIQGGKMDKLQNFSEASVCSVAKKKIKNKPNVKIGKINVSSFMTSEYEGF